MAENPENQPVNLDDVDAPTEKVVKQALSQVPTWEEWLRNNGFKLGKESAYSWSDKEWNRDWPSAGRGWLIKVHLMRNVITVQIFNNWLRWGRSLGLEFFVNEITLPKVVGALIKEIERNVSDHTRKRRLKLLHQQTKPESRIENDDEPVPDAAPVRVEQGDEPHHWAEFHNESSLPRRTPIPDDPTDLSKEQMDALLGRVRVTCLPKGQRVRIRTERNTRLNGMMGTVVDAGPHSCYVALDDYVAAGDDDPFRFEEQELEPVYENLIPDEDAPEGYMASMDWFTALQQLGYKLLAGTYRKSIDLDSDKGHLRISVEPDEKLPAATIYVDYRSEAEGESARIQDIVVPAIEVVDTVREIEALTKAKEVWGITDFAKALGKKNYKGTPIPPLGHLTYLFGESTMEPDDVDNPQPYFDELQRHAEVINAFRKRGMKMRRRMTVERPYYEMFYWHPMSDVSYDIFIEPEPQGVWQVSARGMKAFEDDRYGRHEEDFDIDPVWEIKSSDDIDGDVDEIVSEITSHRGPEEPTHTYPDFDDIDESEDEITNLSAYAASSGGYNPVMLLTSKDIRQIVRSTGFKVSTIYKSRVTQGWSVTATPATAEAFELFKRSGVAEFFEHALREGIMKRLPMLAKIERGMYVFDDKIRLHCWSWSGATSANPENPNNWVLYADIQPADYEQRRRGGKVAENVDDPDVLDPEAYMADTLLPDKVLPQLGYYFDPDRRYWYKQIDPLTQFVIWPQADTYEFNFQLYRLITLPNSGLQRWQMQGSLAGVPMRSLRQRLEKWEKGLSQIDFTKSGALQKLVDEAVDERDDPDEIPDLTSYVKDTTDPVKTLEQAGYKYGLDFDGYKRWKKYWPLPRPLKKQVKWSPTYTKVWGSPDIHGQFSYGFLSEDNHRAKTGYIIVKPLNRITGKDDYDVVTSIRRMLLGVEALVRSLPDTDSVDEAWAYVEQGMEKIQADVNKQADASWHSVSVGRNESVDTAVYPAVNLVEGVKDPDEPDAVLSAHKPIAYALYAQTQYGSPVSFSTYLSLEEAVEQAKSRQLHVEYANVWIEEVEFDSLEGWETGKTMAGRYTNHKYVVNADYTVQRVADIYAYTGHYPRPPRLREDEELADQFDPASYAQTTFDPVAFLQANGWEKLPNDAYESWAKSFPMPQPYKLGGMTFTQIQFRVGFDPQWQRRGFSCSFAAFLTDNPIKNSLPVHGWQLLAQTITPGDPGASDPAMTIRRIAAGVEGVLAKVSWPESPLAALAAQSKVYTAFDSFVRELNDRALTPLYPQAHDV